MAKAFVVAAPSSGSGKTLVTLGLLRALNKAGIRTASAKAGPDYIDPRFHELASGQPCPNLDLWAMGADRCAALLHDQAAQAELVIVEGVMGLFDGPEGAAGSTADLAAALTLPVVLVVDAAHQSQSVAALVHGFKTFRHDITLAGVILNRVASERHARMLEAALTDNGIAVYGAIPRSVTMEWPSRHLGLVQAGDNPHTEQFIESAASLVASALDIAKLAGLGSAVAAASPASLLPPPGQRIAVAHDQAFSFFYPSLLANWRRQGAEVTTFSPLADAPVPPADVVYLPGGYPELHAEKLSQSKYFLPSLRKADALIWGECGGFMVLGQTLVDAQGKSHAMAGLLSHKTSFANRKLQLGYRRLTPLGGPWTGPLRGHEFHYSTLSDAGSDQPLFMAETAGGESLGPMGLIRGRVMGSYAHVIAAEALTA